MVGEAVELVEIEDEEGAAADFFCASEVSAEMGKELRRFGLCSRLVAMGARDHPRSRWHGGAFVG